MLDKHFNIVIYLARQMGRLVFSFFHLGICWNRFYGNTRKLILPFLSA